MSVSGAVDATDGDVVVLGDPEALVAELVGAAGDGRGAGERVGGRLPRRDRREVEN